MVYIPSLVEPECSVGRESVHKAQQKTRFRTRLRVLRGPKGVLRGSQGGRTGDVGEPLQQLNDQRLRMGLVALLLHPSDGETKPIRLIRRRGETAQIDPTARRNGSD
eukprot:1360436-Pyramimonas_sp.AAC.2